MPRTLAAVAALLLGVAFLLAGHGLQLTFLPIRGALQGFTQVELGLLGSAYYAGFVAGCIGAPYLILRSGHIRAFTAMVSLAAVMALAHSLWIDVVPWLVFRAITGACLAGLYLVVESWLNERATNQTRGVILSLYIFVNYAMITVGQLIVTLYAPEGYALFVVASLAISLAAIPVSLTRSAQPAPITMVKLDPIGLFNAAPVALVGVALIGMSVGSFWALGTVYARDWQNLSTSDAAYFMSAGVVGGALAQWPLGKLSDMMDRRLVLFWLAVAAAAVSGILALLPFQGAVLFGLAFLFGASALPGYGLAAAHAYDRVGPDQYVSAAGSVLLANGTGSIVGPLIASLLMTGVGAWALFLFTCLVQVALAAYISLRLKQRPGADQKSEVDLAAPSPVGVAVLLPPDPAGAAESIAPREEDDIPDAELDEAPAPQDGAPSADSPAEMVVPDAPQPSEAEIDAAPHAAVPAAPPAETNTAEPSSTAETAADENVIPIAPQPSEAELDATPPAAKPEAVTPPAATTPTPEPKPEENKN